MIVLAEIPGELLIPILIILAQGWAWWKEKRAQEAQTREDESTLTDEWRDIILEEQRGRGYLPEDDAPPELPTTAQAPEPQPSPVVIPPTSKPLRTPYVPPKKISQQPKVEMFDIDLPTTTPSTPPLSAGDLTDAGADKIKQAPSFHRRTKRRTSRIQALLRTPDAARQAIVLSEVLGPPRALRPLEKAQTHTI